MSRFDLATLYSVPARNLCYVIYEWHKSLSKCREVCSTWKDCIDDQRILWMRIIQKYITIYLKNNNQIRDEYCKTFKNAPVNIVRDLGGYPII